MAQHTSGNGAGTPWASCKEDGYYNWLNWLWQSIKKPYKYSEWNEHQKSINNLEKEERKKTIENKTRKKKKITCQTSFVSWMPTRRNAIRWHRNIYHPNSKTIPLTRCSARVKKKERNAAREICIKLLNNYGVCFAFFPLLSVCVVRQPLGIWRTNVRKRRKLKFNFQFSGVSVHFIRIPIIISSLLLLLFVIKR